MALDQSVEFLSRRGYPKIAVTSQPSFVIGSRSRLSASFRELAP